MKTKKLISFLVILIISQPIYADFKISQKTTVENMVTELTIWSKGVRMRREQNIVMDDPDMASMMEGMAPSLPMITQCDLKQDVTLNDRTKSFFIDYYDWSGLSPEQKMRRPNQKVTIRGTTTISLAVTDSGKRRQMFNLTARWQKAVTTVETSADSCDGKSNVRMEQEGWFVDIAFTADSCQVPRPPESKGGCRPKIILNGIQNPGFFIEGTTKTFEDGKLQSTINTETTALSKATLDQSLFEIPKDYLEVDSFSELMRANSVIDTSAKTVFGGDDETKSGKTVAIDFFSGNTSNVTQDELRGYISGKLTAAGMSGFPINSQSDLISGSFVNVIGVELKKVKESGASKIGGLFGKVTGNDDSAKIGTSEAEITITIYGKDGKTVVATASSKQKVSGKGNDAVKAAIDEIIGGLLDKIK